MGNDPFLINVTPFSFSIVTVYVVAHFHPVEIARLPYTYYM